MKTILRPRKHRYLKRVGIFLIVIALIAGMIACNGDGGGAQYDLTMAVAPPGAGTTTPTGTTSYTAGTAVNITAAATSGYQFVNWSAPAGIFADANAAETTFLMPAQDVTVTANFVRVYSLTMAVNPVGGGTATDLTGGSPYPAGTVVSIQAAAAAGYMFVNWSAPAGGFADPNAPTTTFTMPAQDVTATANFVGLLNHFRCYHADEIPTEPLDEVVYLEDQFGAFNATVTWIQYFCNPVKKVHDGVTTPISDPDHHLAIYDIDYEEEPQTRWLEVSNQFGNQTLTVYGPYMLAVPTQKEGHEKPVGLDHYLLYQVTEVADMDDVVVGLTDQFLDEPAVSVIKPSMFATPVRKTHGGNVTEIENPEAHLLLYFLEGGVLETQVQVDNQFGEQTFDVSNPSWLAVPTEKIEVTSTPPLEHFWCYTTSSEPIDKVVYLEDQFGAFNATVKHMVRFCNPAEKWHEGKPSLIWNPDHHLAIYNIDCEEEPQGWYVTFKNQFGDDQTVIVSGPIMLAVPTQKEGHELPVGLDHFLIYDVIGYVSPPVANFEIILNDQFLWEFEDTYVGAPQWFANPVRKTHGGNVTEIENPDEHLVFYQTDYSGYFGAEWILVSNQFGYEQDLSMINEPDRLGVPSEKIDWGQLPDHFKCYGVEEETAPYIGEVVYLEDQFGAVNATVEGVVRFGNPVEKWYGGDLGGPIYHPAHHLTIYDLGNVEDQEWSVEVSNQFNQFVTQNLTMFGPVALAVPTQKEGHGSPVGLDHFLLYKVTNGPYIGEDVYLKDQFSFEWVSVISPVLFANPVRKTHGGNVTDITNPYDHLVFYEISGGAFQTQVLVDNQFGEQTLDVINPSLLGVPSVKVSYEPYNPE